MHAECSDVCASLAGDPEDSKLAIIVKLKQLALVDGADAKLSLDGRDEWRTLEERTRQRLQSTRQLCLSTWQFVVQSEYCNILLTRTLLALHQSRGPVNADNQTARDLGIEGTRVTGAINAENALQPCDDFVGRRVRGFVEVDDTGRDV